MLCRYSIHFTFVLLAVLIACGNVFADELEGWPSQPSHYVSDRAGMIDTNTERALNGFLQELEQKAGVQFLVVTVQSLEGRTKEGYALGLAERWKLGKKGEDKGLLFLVAQAERKYRFEVGYGLEGLLPDSYIGAVGRERFVPLMKRGKSGEAITAATLTLIQTIAEDAGVQITGMPKLSRMRSGRGGLGSNITSLLFFMFFFIFPIFGGIARRRRYGVSRWRGGHVPWWLFLLGGSGFGGRGGSGFGGSSGFGGFGGGMGGGFGGGGAGGSW